MPMFKSFALIFALIVGNSHLASTFSIGEIWQTITDWTDDEGSKEQVIYSGDEDLAEVYTTCNSYINGRNGTITSPNYPYQYSNGLRCYFRIYAYVWPIEVTINDFHTERSYDYLRIYDGYSSGYPLLGSFSGHFAPGTTRTVTGRNPSRYMYLYFQTDGSSSSIGWSLTFGAVGTTGPIANSSSNCSCEIALDQAHHNMSCANPGEQCSDTTPLQTIFNKYLGPAQSIADCVYFSRSCHQQCMTNASEFWGDLGLRQPISGGDGGKT
ncbi:unnamed protein product [Owenia fusiformis]|uniref:CUB domain-containing protein n=1 Tax=Owenia fusiformis TaxID=6347 RepID=A0A8S4Q5A9_OWEFU|nr:unnamed protein product [Owenia fusiformis]